MAIDYHLKIDGIQGESQHSKHKDEIDILSWSWGATNPVTIVGTGMSAGKVSMSDLTISKRVDKSSPKLLALNVTGAHKDSAILTASKSTGGKSPEDFLTIKLTEVYVASYQIGGSHGEDVGSESLSLAYGKIEYDYKQQDAKGVLKSAGEVGYDLIKAEQSK